MIDEKKIIDRVLSGDADSFSELVTEYEDKVYNLCLRMCGDREEAKDLAQQSFIKAWRGLRFYRHEAAFSTWLYRLTGNVCIDYLRQKKRRTAISLTSLDEEAQQWDVPDPEPTPEQQAIDKQTKEAVAEAMLRLDEESRFILTLRVVEERSYEHIAEVLDVKLGTVKSRLARAREKLRKLLIQSGNDSFAHSSNKKEGEDGL